MSWFTGRIDNLADLNNHDRIVPDLVSAESDATSSTKTNPQNKLELFDLDNDLCYCLTIGNNSFILRPVEVIDNAIDYDFLGLTPTISNELWDTAGELLKSL